MIVGDTVLVRYAVASLIGLGLATSSGPAFAYRPFDGTDAAVADPGEVEVELQPAGLQHEGASQTLIAPATVLNFGLNEGWEAVFEGQGETPLSPSGAGNLTSAGAFLKHVVVPGSLQGNVDIFRAQHVVERSVTQAVGLTRVERLIDHVPHVDGTAKVLHLAHDVVLNPLGEQAHVGCIRSRERGDAVGFEENPGGGL